MYVNKWAGFSVSVVCTCSAGLAYCFSLYSNQLKEAFGYDQRQIQAIGSATNLGGYTSIISGLVYDSMLGWDGRGPRQAWVQSSQRLQHLRMSAVHCLSPGPSSLGILCRLVVLIGVVVNVVGWVSLWAAAKG